MPPFSIISICLFASYLIACLINLIEFKFLISQRVPNSLPGFLTDILGILFVIPITRKIFFKKITSNYKDKKKNFIDGEYEDIDDLNKHD